MAVGKDKDKDEWQGVGKAAAQDNGLSEQETTHGVAIAEIFKELGLNSSYNKRLYYASQGCSIYTFTECARTNMSVR